MSDKISLSEIISELSIEKKEAEILTAFLLNKTRESLLTDPDIKTDKLFYKKIKALEKKRLKNYPIAYLIGEKEFYGLNFKVNKDVLVPRPETEMMVDKIIEILKNESNNFEKDLDTSKNLFNDNYNNPVFIDIGTGSGAIIIAIANEIKKFWPNDSDNFKFYGTDISEGDLKIAKKNARLHNLNKTINFFAGNLLEPVIKKLTKKNLIIAANLPYLTPAQVKGSPSISREPKLALVAGHDGLKYYRELFYQLENIKYKSLILFCEIDPSQSNSITSLAKKIFPTAKLEIIKDLASLDRFLKIIN
ncbi:MAG: peptide chain release factor N(5)-glutamine methyltransferase [Patescibacteria group bacterium]